MPSGRVSAMFNGIDSYRDLPDMLMRRIAHFFEHYKDLETGNGQKSPAGATTAEARDMIAKAIEAGKPGITV